MRTDSLALLLALISATPWLDHGIADGVYARPDVWTWLWAQHR